MSKYKLCWWENNGYHDSDWFGVYFDTADGQLHKTELGSTRYGGPIGFTEEYLLPTPAIVELARQEFVPIIFASLRSAEHRDILEPGPRNVKTGRAFRLLRPHSVYAKDNSRFVLNAAGKRVKLTFDAGHVFVSRSDEAGFFGTSYAKGYNQPHRGNTTISTKYIQNGNTFFCRIPMEKLRQDAEPMTDMALMLRSESLSYNLEFGASFGCRGWTSDNWAQAALAKTA